MELFAELTADERIIIEILRAHEKLHIDELYFKSPINSSAMASALLTLEMQGVIGLLPGKIYKVL